MGNIIACVDGSAYADSVCDLAAWAASRTDGTVSLLHVAAPHTDTAIKGDLSGQIGLGAKSELLAELTEAEAEHGRQEQKKGQEILDRAEERFHAKSDASVTRIHRRGDFFENVAELESSADLIILGKQGEDSVGAADHLGAELAELMRTPHQPILLAARESTPMGRILIAFDGGKACMRAVDYAAKSPLLKGLDCHLVTVGTKAEAAMKTAAETLASAGLSVRTEVLTGSSVPGAVQAYADARATDLLVIGASSHSKIHHLIWGSTTEALILHADGPVLLFGA
ncbi:universal stress protein [Kordiimonas marina]|uniref:universal stress protein n=1 Tax=Kordiimonas marina TaxID=2872312 RepID=UPI001FF22854|nr:universal stress protein [Kordiimonas marina]MCJ9430524.1 universal stress protein [Kordiimonas marina]